MDMDRRNNQESNERRLWTALFWLACLSFRHQLWQIIQWLVTVIVYILLRVGLLDVDNSNETVNQRTTENTRGTAVHNNSRATANQGNNGIEFGQRPLVNDSSVNLAAMSSETANAPVRPSVVEPSTLQNLGLRTLEEIAVELGNENYRYSGGGDVRQIELRKKEPLFDGEPFEGTSDPLLFHRKFENFCLLMKYNEVQVIHAFVRALKGTTNDFILREFPEAGNGNGIRLWYSIKERFCDRFNVAARMLRAGGTNDVQA